jgi:hypothetical protein
MGDHELSKYRTRRFYRSLLNLPSMTSSAYSYVDKQHAKPVFKMQEERPRIVSFEMLRFPLTLPSLKRNPPSLCLRAAAHCYAHSRDRQCAVHCHTASRDAPDCSQTTSDYKQVERCTWSSSCCWRPCCGTGAQWRWWLGRDGGERQA